MYKILFTSALPWELKTVKSIIKTFKSNIKIDYLSTWIWNYKTILNLSKHLTQNNYDFIVNVGICGFIEKSNPFQVARIFNISNSKELLVPIPFKFLSLDSISCSENIVYDKKELQDENYVDMESYWFELVCDDFKIPRIIIKAPFDEIWSKETISFDKNQALDKLKQIDFEKLIEKIVEFLDKYKKKDHNFDKYYSHYNLTFAEKLIFQKIYFRYAGLIWKDFDNFFEKNCGLAKKEFLKMWFEIE